MITIRVRAALLVVSVVAVLLITLGLSLVSGIADRIRAANSARGASRFCADPGVPPAPPPEKTHSLDPIQLMAQTRVFLRIRVSTPAGDVVP